MQFHLHCATDHAAAGVSLDAEKIDPIRDADIRDPEVFDGLQFHETIDKVFASGDIARVGDIKRSACKQIKGIVIELAAEVAFEIAVLTVKNQGFFDVISDGNRGYFGTSDSIHYQANERLCSGGEGDAFVGVGIM